MPVTHQSMSAATLFARKLFDHDDDNKSKTKAVCPVEDTTGPELVPLVGNLSFHSLATILTGACAVFCFIVIAIVVGLHAVNTD